ncbi:MAG: hypothetical protein PHO02_06545 [Candidatus Nanoarchaeia archaeon]|nr:hypothetical protein [Candidatus Nanoarchaeia archaeon]
MKKRVFAVVFAVMLIIVFGQAVFAPDCTPDATKGCSGNVVWWFDSCGNPTRVDSYCAYNQECVDGNCVMKCGNGRCDSGETCSSCSQDCGCSSSQRCSWSGQCETYCGNGQCDGSENCNSCVSDCGCGSNKRCSYSGQCETFCGNGQCDGNENCNTCFQDCGCSKSEECAPGGSRTDNRGCASLCGNGKKDMGEDCTSCALDAGCGSSTYCLNGQCVDCIRDEHCATRDTPTGEFICASDFRSTLEKVVRKAGLCRDNKCTGEDVETTRQGKQCGNLLCQDGHCGCNEGYQVCLATGKCEKTGELEDGSNCGCYHQCSSNYCSREGKCMRALNTILSSEKDLISEGQDTTVTISADNTLDSDIPVKLTLNIDTGASMSGVIGGADCTGNQCTGGQITVPAKGRTSVEVKITGRSANKVKLTSVITPVIEGIEYPKTEEVFITVIDADDGKCTEGETSSNACVDCGCPEDTSFHSYSCDKEENSCDKDVGWWMYMIIGILVLVIVLIYFGATKGKAIYARLASERETRQAEKDKVEKAEQAKQDADRKKVIKALYRMKIDADNPPTVHEIIKKLDMDADDDIIEEEYEQMLRRMEKKPRAVVERNAEPAAKTSLFCTKCGARLKAGVKFCTKCGAVVKGR